MIVLLNPRIANVYDSIRTTYSKLPPTASLALLSCETNRNIRMNDSPTRKIDIYERAVVGIDFLKNIENANIIGFANWFSNYAESIEIARLIKSENEDVIIVFGGPDATNKAARILFNQNTVDYVVYGDGEDTLWRIALDHPPHTIPNLIYRDNSGAIKRARSKEYNLDELGLFDFDNVVNLDLSAYDSRRPDYKYDPSLLPISLSWIRGCPKSASDKRCKYCSIPSSSIRYQCPEKAWAQVDHLKNKYGISSFFEGGDDFSAGTYVEDLLKHPDRVQDITLRAYSGLWRLSESKVCAMYELGLRELFVGIETVDKNINKWSGHNVSHDLIHRSLKLLESYGITVCIPFIFGLPGESEHSLTASEHLASELINKYSNIRMVLISLAMPLIGSGWFEQLENDAVIQRNYRKGDLSTTDDPDYANLLELSIERYCSVSLGDITRTVERIRDRFSMKSAVGCYGGLDYNYALIK